MAVDAAGVPEVEVEEGQSFQHPLLLACLVDRDLLRPVSVSYKALTWLANVMD